MLQRPPREAPEHRERLLNSSSPFEIIGLQGLQFCFPVGSHGSPGKRANGNGAERPPTTPLRLVSHVRNEEPAAPGAANPPEQIICLRNRIAIARNDVDLLALMGGRTPAPPWRDRCRLGGDLQQQIAETARAGAMPGSTKLALGLGAGRGAAVAVIGQRNQPDKQQIFATGCGFGRIRHDITPCRQRVGAVGNAGDGIGGNRGDSCESPLSPRCRPPRPSGSLHPRLVSGLRSVLIWTGVAPSRGESPGGSVPRPFSDTVAGAASVLHRLPNSPRFRGRGTWNTTSLRAADRQALAKTTWIGPHRALVHRRTGDDGNGFV